MSGAKRGSSSHGFSGVKIEYSKPADALSVSIREIEVARSEDIQDGVVVDFDDKGQIVGIEILDVSSKLSLADLCNVSIENLPVELAEPTG